jgi:hypothetical protein
LSPYALPNGGIRTVNSISSLQVEQRGLSIWRIGTMANTLATAPNPNPNLAEWATRFCIKLLTRNLLGGSGSTRAAGAAHVAADHADQEAGHDMG